MKKYLKVVILGVCILFAGCSSPSSSVGEWMQPSEKVKVLSTTAMIDDIVAQVGGERVDHIPLILGEIDPHSYELVKGDDEKFTFAQIIFYNGLGLEHGASVRFAFEEHPLAINLGKSIFQKVPDKILYAGEQIDPHVWMDISLWSYIVDPIAETLSSVDPSGRAFYEKNATELKQKMLQQHGEIQKAFTTIPDKQRYLVTSHDAFNYFARAYLASSEEESGWAKRFHAPEGLAPEGQLSTTHIQEIVSHLMHNEIKVVFPESNVSPDSLKKIINACRHKGLEVAISSELLYADAMGNQGSGAEDYFKMMQHDAEVMINAWMKQ